MHDILELLENLFKSNHFDYKDRKRWLHHLSCQHWRCEEKIIVCMTHSVLVCTNRMCPKWPKVYFDSRYVCVCVCVSCVCWIKWKMDKNSWQFAIWNYRIAFLEFVHFTKRQRWQFSLFFRFCPFWICVFSHYFDSLLHIIYYYHFIVSCHVCQKKKNERIVFVCFVESSTPSIHPRKIFLYFSVNK